MNINSLIDSFAQKRVIVSEYLQHKIKVKSKFYLNYEVNAIPHDAFVEICFMQNENFYTEDCLKEAIKMILVAHDQKQIALINIAVFLTSILKTDVDVELTVEINNDDGLMYDTHHYSVERKYYGK